MNYRHIICSCILLNSTAIIAMNNEKPSFDKHTIIQFLNTNPDVLAQLATNLSDAMQKKEKAVEQEVPKNLLLQPYREATIKVTQVLRATATAYFEYLADSESNKFFTWYRDNKSKFEQERDLLYEKFLVQDPARAIYLAHPCSDALKVAALQIIGQLVKEEADQNNKSAIINLASTGLILSPSVQRLINMLEPAKK